MDPELASPAAVARIGIAALMTRGRWIEVGRIALTGLVSALYWQAMVPVELLWAAVAVGLYPLVKTGLRDLVQDHKIGTEIFVTVATLIAVFGGETLAGAVLMVIILVAEFIADLNTDRARASIHALIGSVPQTALLRREGREVTVKIDQLVPGDVVLVRAGERVPVDGVVDAGDGAVNEASLTGESLPCDKRATDEVFAGTVLESGALDVRATRIGADTMFSRIIALVEQAEEHQAPVQKLADRVAAWLMPVVLVFLVAVFVVTQDLRKVVTLLIFTSPAELGLATPLVMIAAIARAARQGVLIKGGLYLELLAKVDTIVFDKTGTLTANRPQVVGVVPMAPGVSGDRLLALAAAADRRSAHPLAQAVVEAARRRGLPLEEPDAFESITGRGVKAKVGSAEVLVGNPALLREAGVAGVPELQPGPTTSVHVAVGGVFAGVIHIADTIRDGAADALRALRRSGVRHIVMLTGDGRHAAEAVARELSIDDVRPGLLPADKADAILALQRNGRRVAMVGDGVNDAPSLALADVGIAMGARGTQAALEAADVALMTDDLRQIVFARSLARRAYRTIQENLIVGVGIVHVLGIAAALLGWIGPIEAAIIHLGPDILVFLNSVKLVNVRIADT